MIDGDNCHVEAPLTQQTRVFSEYGKKRGSVANPMSRRPPIPDVQSS